MASELADPTPTAAADPSDAALLAAHVDGDPDAFGELFTRHRDRLWAVALRTCSDPETAADALQEAMVSAFRRAATFRGEAAVTTWLHRIVVNACLDRLRQARVRRAEPLPEDLDEHPGAIRQRAGDAVDPAEHSLAQERRRQVHAALAQLPAEQRAAIVLVDMEGYPVAEVAAMLECAEGTVKSRCSRGRARLAVLLAEVLDDPDVPAVVTAPAGGNPPSGPDVTGLTPRGPPPAPAPTTD